MQARSQDLEKGGAFLKGWEKCKRPWPEFSLFLNQFHTVCPKIKTKFLEKLGNSNVFSAQNQVVSKKKRGGAVFLWGGLFSIFHKKSASKAPKTCNFAYFTNQWRGSSPPPPPWLRYWLYGTFRSPRKAGTSPTVYHARCRLQTVPFNAERQAGKLGILIFAVFSLTWPGIKLGSTVSVSDVLKIKHWSIEQQSMHILNLAHEIVLFINFNFKS